MCLGIRFFVGVHGALHPRPVGERDGVAVDAGFEAADVSDEFAIHSKRVML